VIGPNLASRPFLNTRPVWLVTVAAGVLIVVFVFLNISFYISSGKELAPQLAYARDLENTRDQLSDEVRGIIAELDEVPWKSLSSRVSATNVVLREWSFSWLGLFDDIERVMPREVRVIRIAPSVADDGVTLSLEAIARNRDATLEFLENLIADPSFSEPIPIREQFPEQAEHAGYDLTLRVTYHPGEGNQ
jgi:hypothetical protein